MSKNKIYTKLIVISICILFLLTIFFIFNKDRNIDKPQKNITSASLRLKWLYDTGFAGELVAKKLGYFEKYGLNLDIKPGGFESDPIKLVTSGVDNIGVAGADSFVIGRSKGIPIVAFAAGYQKTPVVFYVKDSSNINSTKDFIGKTVGVQAGQDTETIYQAILNNSHIDRKLIKEYGAKYDFTPFLTGQVDVWPGYAATQSFTLKEKNIPYHVISPEDYGVALIGTVYFTTEDFIKSHPEVIQSFVNGLRDGWDETYNNQSESIKIINSYDPINLTEDVIRWDLDKQKKYIIPDGTRPIEFTSKQWESTLKTLKSSGLIEKDFEIDNGVDYTFLNNLYKK